MLKNNTPFRIIFKCVIVLFIARFTLSAWSVSFAPISSFFYLIESSLQKLLEPQQETRKILFQMTNCGGTLY